MFAPNDRGQRKLLVPYFLVIVANIYVVFSFASIVLIYLHILTTLILTINLCGKYDSILIL